LSEELKKLLREIKVVQSLRLVHWAKRWKLDSEESQSHQWRN
jgi:hypothetical protein